ncbi:Na-translocating system protein MpsC family protein [Paenibacillus sp. GCM10028914]|uniref:Na-translocating system protein MpsC family protein n=1 Tax=Paenibacillus sp. GCM10028914 TaxID=3273416 RepID=UPI0036199FDC
MITQTQINLVSSFTGKLLRERFGKGPESVHVSIGDRSITLHVRNFIGPVEKFLLSKEEEQALRYTRELLMKSLLPELTIYLKDEIGLEVDEMFYDWGLHNATGIIVGLFQSAVQISTHYEGQAEVHKQIALLTSKVQKEPEQIDSWWMNPRTLIVVREGILIMLEKELIGLGYENVLKTTKRKLEKRVFGQDNRIGQLLGKELSDVYVDWDFERDKGIVAYIFHS